MAYRKIYELQIGTAQHPEPTQIPKKKSSDKILTFVFIRRKNADLPKRNKKKKSKQIAVPYFVP